MKSKQLADRVVVLRDGKFSGELSRDQNQAAEHGAADGWPRRVAILSSHASHAGRRRACRQSAPHDDFPRRAVSFTLRAGEVVGLAGLVGAGRSELLGTLFGVTPAVGGGMTLGALRRPPQSVREAIAAGIVLAPEDRRRAGLFLPMSVKRNLSLASLRRDQRRGMLTGFLNRAAENRVSAAMMRLMRIKTPSDRQVVRLPLRRQSAEGRARQMALPQPKAAPAR